MMLGSFTRSLKPKDPKTREEQDLLNFPSLQTPGEQDYPGFDVEPGLPPPGRSLATTETRRGSQLSTGQRLHVQYRRGFWGIQDDGPFVALREGNLLASACEGRNKRLTLPRRTRTGKTVPWPGLLVYQRYVELLEEPYRALRADAGVLRFANYTHAIHLLL